MTRELRVVDGGDPRAVLEALREALAGGRAVLPHPGAPEGLPKTVPKRVAVVVETSGSTGKPKRVALGADALLASSAASESALGGPGQWLLALPANYIAGINVLVRSITSQTEPVFLSPGRFDPFAFAVAADTMVPKTSDAVRRFTSLVPAQLARLLGAGAGAGAGPDAEDGLDADDGLETLRSFDRILVGGQATPEGLLSRALELGLNVTRSYGSSETSGGCVYDGVAIAGVNVAVRNGQIELSGPMLAEGYLGDPARTDAAFPMRSGSRWYRTGDTGELADGVLRVTGRVDDLIVSGGLKVSLAAIERVVRGVPGFAEAIVVAGVSEQWGQVAVIVSNDSADLETVRDAVEVAVGKVGRPDRVVVVGAIPLLFSGKPDRAALLRLVDDGRQAD